MQSLVADVDCVRITSLLKLLFQLKKAIFNILLQSLRQNFGFVHQLGVTRVSLRRGHRQQGRTIRVIHER